MSYLFLIVLFILMSWGILRIAPKFNLDKKSILLGWGIKILWACSFMYAFSYHFSNDGQPQGDMGNFLHDGKILAELAQEEPTTYIKLLIGVDADDPELLQAQLEETQIWDYGLNGDLLNDNRLIIRINSLIHFISSGNKWIHLLVFAFISFLGTLLLYRFFATFVLRKKLFWYALMIIPTLGFWSSGISKEALFILSFGLLIHGIGKLIRNEYWLGLTYFLIGVWCCFFNKPHIGLIIIPLCAILLLGYRFGLNKKGMTIFSLSVLLIFVGLTFTPEKINIVNRISAKQADFINVAKGGIFFVNDSAFCAFDYQNLEHFNYYESTKKIQVIEKTEGEYKLFGQREFHSFNILPKPTKYDVYLVVPPSETYVETKKIDGEWKQLLRNTPMAVANVFIRPLPNPKGSIFTIPLFIENLLFIAFLGFTLIKRKKLKQEERVWVYYLVSSAILLTLIIGWTTPVIGAVIRYKMAPCLFLIIAAFILLDKSKKLKE